MVEDPCLACQVSIVVGGTTIVCCRQNLREGDTKVEMWSIGVEDGVSSRIIMHVKEIGISTMTGNFELACKKFAFSYGYSNPVLSCHGIKGGSPTQQEDGKMEAKLVEDLRHVSCVQMFELGYEPNLGPYVMLRTLNHAMGF